MAVVNGTGALDMDAHSMGERMAALVLQGRVDEFKRLDASTLTLVCFFVQSALASAPPEATTAMAAALERLHAAGANAGAAH